MAGRRPLRDRLHGLASRRTAVVIVGLLTIVVLALVVGSNILDAVSGVGAGDGIDLIEDASGGLQYALVFLLVPWLGIAPVIVIAIGVGANPVGVGVSAFLGAVVPIGGFVLFYERLEVWWGARNEDDTASKRHRRLRRVWNRYGLPGFALVSPAVIGVVVAAGIALGLRSEKRAVFLWMTVSTTVWVLVTTVGTYYGISYLI